MTIISKKVALLILVAVAELALADAASARGGGSSFMNSPGYQRRLQESRGYVTNQSGSIFPKPAASAPVHRSRKSRHR
ncbi:hypothetical protein [Tardiphaga sp. P9-11]|jgi:hypothetical protein|uniref:hypothetical protein n=1 Tax=Tardiphaga sp. P9-11 TaxID=2024614 RepID=UPI0011F0DD15|nr:hypothetical protein [Tardiphaga sp. P9-11]KAA0072596.1 hypothetical protein CIW50_25250 [Tardiphaga sp. P9-11]